MSKKNKRTYQPEIIPVPGGKQMIARYSVNIRSGPSIGAACCGDVEEGTIVDVLSEAKGTYIDFAQIKDGWVVTRHDNHSYFEDYTSPVDEGGAKYNEKVEEVPVEEQLAPVSVEEDHGFKFDWRKK